jgi:hypothetical protein
MQPADCAHLMRAANFESTPMDVSSSLFFINADHACSLGGRGGAGCCFAGWAAGGGGRVGGGDNIVRNSAHLMRAANSDRTPMDVSSSLSSSVRTIRVYTVSSQLV